MKKQIGMTLIELMVAIVILAIMASVAVPSMKSFFDRNNLKVVGPIFEKSLQLARSEAIQRSQTVRLTPKGNGKDWSQGWNISLVTGPNPADVQLIRTFDPLPGNPAFVSDTYDATTPLDILPNGQASLIGGFTLNLSGCPDDKMYNYNVLLSGILNRSVTACP
ncbi:MAG: GspH/FimT family pseudopilin [Gammaproteobacteria bacterium]|nr:GspH/FimT family pseudopilin [Gammaproteobacteria bacterium]